MPKKKQPSPGDGWAGGDVALLKRDIAALYEQEWQWLVSLAEMIEKHARPGVDVASVGMELASVVEGPRLPLGRAPRGVGRQARCDATVGHDGLHQVGSTPLQPEHADARRIMLNH